MSDFGSAIRARRKELGLTQQALGDLAGVTREQISKLEGGGVSPMFDTIDRILSALQWDLHDLADALEGYRPGWEMRTGPDGTERPVLLTEPAVIAESRITYGENLEQRVAALEAELDVHRRLSRLEAAVASKQPVESEADLIARIRAEALAILDEAQAKREQPQRRQGGKG